MRALWLLGLASGCAQISNGDVERRGELIQQVAAGELVSCYLRSTGEPSCVGLLDGGTVDGFDQPFAEFILPEPAGLGQLSRYGGASCGIGALGGFSCWGRHHLTGEGAPPFGDQERFIQITDAGSHACAIRDGGDLTCWGPTSSQPSQPDAGFTQVSTRLGATCAVQLNGAVQCWGPDPESPVLSGAPVSGAVEVAVGDDFACARLETGSLACWGDPPAGIDVAGPWDFIAAGSRHFCAAVPTQSGSCWADPDLTALTERPGDTMISLSGSSTQACAVMSEGGAECWGYNDHGELDTPTW